MGYDVHITRKEEWSDEDGPEITIEEWLAVVEADPELRHDGFAQVEAPDGSILRAEAPGLSAWTAHPDTRPDGDLAWLSYRDGEVVVKNPDRAFLVKLVALADQLDANLQGDEGEYYDLANLPDDTPDPPPTKKSRRWFNRG